ncbi:hypothetical protein [Pseudomonas putida]|uniref:Uncharacterized protein n=1 Tax=Pseudomonas putida TaxID=303 RepID=A0A8I1EBM7_PSEPU|nr:hypothetical protein [Pseudomonas putida]MBI6882328.1 hypothetical protein [Pseudomonas putida]
MSTYKHINFNDYSPVESDDGDCFIGKEKSLDGASSIVIPSKGFRFFGGQDLAGKKQPVASWTGYHDVVMIPYKFPIIISGKVYVSEDYGSGEFLDDYKVFISSVVDLSIVQDESHAATARLSLAAIRALAKEIMYCVAEDSFGFIDADEDHLSNLY